MIVPAQVRNRYNIAMPYVERVAERVRNIVRRYADVKGMPTVGRIKSVESLTEKLESGRFTNWSGIDDLYACVIVMPTLGSEPSAIEFLDREFERVEMRSRGSTKKDPEVFRFDATRFVGRLRPDAALDEEAELRSVTFEVQLRTAFEHAWSAATHSLAYKSDRIDWRRYRLSAQLKASVEQLDQLIQGFEEAATSVSAHEWPELDAKAAIEVFFREAFERGVFPPEHVPQSWGRFCENMYSLLLASVDPRPRDKLEFVRERLGRLESLLASNASSDAPLSVTVIQLCLGTLAEHGDLHRPLFRFCPLLGDQVTSLFPRISVLGDGVSL